MEETAASEGVAFVACMANLQILDFFKTEGNSA
jgi:hypothetical protein